VSRMITAGLQDRDRKSAEHLHLLRSLANELERAMHAIAHNSLSELEESVTNQQVLSTRLGKLADDLCVPLEENPAASESSVDESLMSQIDAAAETLQRLNHRYSILLQHSSRSVSLMTSLFNSFQGQLQEASAPRSKYQTWSCQM
jgi:hypothetical protein